MHGTLFIVGTPIGNLEDMTFRAVRILGEVDAIACEDTRTSRALLDRYEISKPTFSCHEHNEAGTAEQVVKRLNAGESIALITDAGMPGMSDPGARVVDAVHRAGLPVRVVPGASSVVAAASVSGFPTDSFVYVGFLPKKAGERAALIESWAYELRPVVFHESPKRITSTLSELAAVMPDRDVAVTRELTKVHEEIRSGTASALAEAWSGGGEEERGEFTLVLGPASDDVVHAPADIGKTVRDLMERLDCSRKDAVRIAVSAFGLPRQAVYRASIEEEEDD